MNNNSVTLPGRKYCAINLSRLGYSRRDISKATNLSKKVISVLIKQRNPILTRKKRKSIITDEISRFLKVFFSRFSTYMGGSLMKATQKVNEIFGTSIKSTNPIRNWLKQNKYHHRNKIIREPYPRRIIMSRLAFCRKFLKDSNINKKILFTDEKTFQLQTNHHKGDKMWVQGKKNIVQSGILYKNVFVKISAGISFFGKTRLIFLPRKFTGRVYSDEVLPIFKEELLKHHLKYFMQDNSTIHYEKKFVVPKLTEFSEILDWPVRSPDLNPIENLWSYLSYKVKQRKAENLRQLKIIIQEEYDQIPHSMIQNLCNSFHSRLQKCVDLKGQMIS